MSRLHARGALAETEGDGIREGDFAEATRPTIRAEVRCPNAATEDERVELARWMAGAISRLLAGMSVNERYEAASAAHAEEAPR